jgi:uncharacterized protein (DUF488 family)
LTIHTIGHSKLPIDRFLSLLAENRIKLLVDIRSVPYSRFAPQFNRKALEAVLLEAGFEYLFLGDKLGGRIQDPDCYLEGKLPEMKAGMAALVDYEALKAKAFFAEGVAELLSRAGEGSSAIMCSEEDPDRCHRKLLVGRRLLEEGVELVHIRSKVGTVQPELFRE